MSIQTQIVNYTDSDLTLKGFVAYPARKEAAPLVLICHDWTGRNAFAEAQAVTLAEQGYVGFALDMYGEGIQGENNQEKERLMMPLMTDRQCLRQRVMAALQTAAELSAVDPERIAVIGFCFGGLCALDLARASTQIKAAVSFHGFLDKPDLDTSALSANIMVFHGYQDPMIAASTLPPFYDEMTAAGVDWQVHIHGQAKHAFTNPHANDPTLGTVYCERTAKRTFTAMMHFLQEALG